MTRELDGCVLRGTDICKLKIGLKAPIGTYLVSTFHYNHSS